MLFAGQPLVDIFEQRRWRVLRSLARLTPHHMRYDDQYLRTHYHKRFALIVPILTQPSEPVVEDATLPLRAGNLVSDALRAVGHNTVQGKRLTHRLAFSGDARLFHAIPSTLPRQQRPHGMLDDGLVFVSEHYAMNDVQRDECRRAIDDWHRRIDIFLDALRSEARHLNAQLDATIAAATKARRMILHDF